MIHRHLAIRPGTPAEEWPAAAVVDVLERGDLEDWRPIAAAVRRAPFGAFAARVLRLVDAYPRYGTAPLWRAWIDRCRTRAEGRATAIDGAMTLSALRRSLGLTQSAVAGQAGMSQSDLSKFERRSDVRLGTLRDYAAAIGGRARVTVELAGRAVEVTLPAEAPRRRNRRRRTRWDRRRPARTPPGGV
ncbi:MAG: helix-turn-helix domain-containing protein [Planctomycetes bacterium]|nr:helix-turn-helix domain-containing protein [Planctomycetota bacterium]